MYHSREPESRPGEHPLAAIAAMMGAAATCDDPPSCRDAVPDLAPTGEPISARNRRKATMTSTCMPEPPAPTGSPPPAPLDSAAGNRLGGETSPYLRQHRDNPVHWLPWGDEAFALAEQQDKPILLSIGYAACHWCHVMAHESFEDR